MHELLQFDKQLFYFINQGLSNPVTDFFMPLITSLHYWLPFYILGIVYLIFRYRVKGIYILVALLFAVGLCDFVNAQLLKEYFMRIRPCRALDNVNLLVHCGLGYSFPSNHAVNNFAAATVLSHFFKRKVKAFYFFAGLVAISRVFVGVHYFSDILVGSLEGFLIAFLLVYCLKKLDFDKAVVEKIRIN